LIADWVYRNDQFDTFLGCRPLRGLDYFFGDVIQGWRAETALTPG
jgi:hypothetical protein